MYRNEKLCKCQSNHNQVEDEKVEPDKKNQMSKQGNDYIDADLPHDRPTVPQNQCFLGSMKKGTPSHIFFAKGGICDNLGENSVSQYQLFPSKL